MNVFILARCPRGEGPGKLIHTKVGGSHYVFIRSRILGKCSMLGEEVFLDM